MRHQLQLPLVLLFVFASFPAGQTLRAEAPPAAVPAVAEAPPAAVPAVAAAQTAAPSWSEARIAGVVIAAGQVAISAGQVAQTQARAKDVKDFAKMMVSDHTAMNKQARELAKKLRLTPEDGEAGKVMRDAGKRAATALAKRRGTAFDRQYVADEIDRHQRLVDALDAAAASAGGGELKSLLQTVRPAISAHLEQAKQLQAALTGGK